MRMKIVVRKGTASDAKAAIDVLRASISQLCIADHKNDEKQIADWLSNKTEQAWITWLDRQDATVLVAEKANETVGVGVMNQHGEILLNYVTPDARYSGVSKAILEALENTAVKQGIRECVLESTRTVKPFYESCGYRAANRTGLKLKKRL